MTSDLGRGREAGVEAATAGSADPNAAATSAGPTSAGPASAGPTSAGPMTGGNGRGPEAVVPAGVRAANILPSGDGSPLEDFEFRPHNCFACGELNANGLHLQLHLEPGSCWTELSPDRRFEGWEGVVHGGILCTILDEVMAWSLVEQDNWGVTARMNVEFRRPVTVGLPIRAEGWITEDRRRLQKTAGRIVDAATGQELVRAEATYVAAPEDKKQDLKRRYAYREERAQAVRDARAAQSAPAAAPEPVRGEANA